MSGDKDNGAAQVAAARSRLGRRREVYLLFFLFFSMHFFLCKSPLLAHVYGSLGRRCEVNL
jgi:hypothetical protein